MLKLHGVEHQVAIPSTLHVRPDGVDADAELKLRWDDWGFTIPAKVRASLAEEVVVSLVVVATSVR